MLRASLRNIDENKTIQLYGAEEKRQLISITGLNPAPAQINTSAGAGIDGTRFNSAQLTQRNIVVTVRLNDVENERKEFVKYFSPKARVRLSMYLGASPAYIEGYVETFEVDLYTISETVQISIVCPDPYFRDVNLKYATITNSTPQAISTDSLIETGVLIDATILTTNRVDSVTFRNNDTGEEITLEYTLEKNDIVHISTIRGSKSVTVEHNGITTNVFGYITPSSRFFGCKKHASTFSAKMNGTTLSSGLMSAVITYQELFAGV